MEYQYPDNLKSKPVLWFWELKHIVIIGALFVFSFFILSTLKTFIPLVLTAGFAFLTIRMDDITILDYLKRCIQYFIGQQIYFWR